MITQARPILMKSKRRVQEHGEVFTPEWVVNKMVALPGIKEKTEDIFATFLEPSAGEGAFLLAIEALKLRYVTENYIEDMWDTYALWVLSSIYGIEYLEDNLSVARHYMLDLFAEYYEYAHGTPLLNQSDVYKSARTIIWSNIVQGNTLTYKNQYGEDIIFSHWKQVSDSVTKVHRKPFNYALLNKKNEYELHYVQSSLFDDVKPQRFTSLSPLRFSIVDIRQVWKEVLDNV